MNKDYYLIFLLKSSYRILLYDIFPSQLVDFCAILRAYKAYCMFNILVNLNWATQDGYGLLVTLSFIYIV